IALYRWKRETKPSVLPGERFLGAMRLGFQYVKKSPRMRDALVRSTAFFLHAAALLALLPLVAKRLGTGGAETYTLLLSALGAVIEGTLADLFSVPTSLAVSAASMLVALAFTRTRTLEGAQDHTPTHPFEEPVPALPLELDEGPVMVTIEYFVDPGRREEFE